MHVCIPFPCRTHARFAQSTDRSIALVSLTGLIARQPGSQHGYRAHARIRVCSYRDEVPMNPLSPILGRRWGLPRPQTRAILRQRDLRVPMDDGAVLLADRWLPVAANQRPQPTVLVRSCSGRGQFFGLLHGRLLAERGLQVVIQSVRGTFGSEGAFHPFVERADGLATRRWLRAQPWHAGPIGMTGES
jgi:predicted acyl esterase